MITWDQTCTPLIHNNPLGCVYATMFVALEAIDFKPQFFAFITLSNLVTIHAEFLELVFT